MAGSPILGEPVFRLKGQDMKSKKAELIGNILIGALVVGCVLAYAADIANRTESRLAARAERTTR
jgi:hypothetical protein